MRKISTCSISVSWNILRLKFDCISYESSCPPVVCQRNLAQGYIELRKLWDTRYPLTSKAKMYFKYTFIPIFSHRMEGIKSRTSSFFFLTVVHEIWNWLSSKPWLSKGVFTSFLKLFDILNTIGGRWYFGRVLVPLRLKNQSLYHKI